MPPSEALDRVLDGMRRRFVDSFESQCTSLGALVDQIASLGAAGPVAALRQASHRLTGLAGTIGFPAISPHRRAAP